MFNLDGQIVLITGAGSKKGIGRTTAHQFAKAGATVILNDLYKEELDSNVREMRDNGWDAYAYSGDITDEESVIGLINTIINRFGRIDVLVNNAGISQKATVSEMKLEDVQKIFNVNVFGLFLVTREVIKVMMTQNYGRIIHVSSVSAKRGGGIFGGAHYSASKAAVLGFSKNLAREVSKYGITTNCVTPGLINTEIWKSLPKELADKIIEGIPMERPGEVEEVANTIVFLGSKEASYITGEEIDINGGQHMD